MKNKWIFVLFLFSSIVHAQLQLKHPRVAELEDQMIRDTGDYIRARFPGTPFTVKIDIDALHRTTADLPYKEEELPFFSMNTEEIADEWDDPSTSLKSLLRRVRRIVLTISLPEKVQETEVSEMKENLFSYLHLVPTRDSIEISRKAWTVKQEIPWLFFYIGAGVLFIFLLAMILSNRLAAGKIARVLATSSKGGQTMTATLNMPAQSLPIPNHKNEQQGMSSGELKFTDPLKVREILQVKIRELVSSNNFPTLRDILVLNDLGLNRPSLLGAIMLEFPVNVREDIFSLSLGKHWGEALAFPGTLNFEALEIVEGLLHHPRDNDPSEWEKLLISLWRLGEELGSFLKGLSKEEAFTLLHDLPKNLAVPVAQEIYPGLWGELLVWEHKQVRLSIARMQELYEKALQVKPLISKNILIQHRMERELFEFLRYADLNAEKSIYNAVADTKELELRRPPFYKVFEQDEIFFKGFVDMINLEEWAYALQDVPFSLRSMVTNNFAEKKRYMFGEKIKTIGTDSESKEKTAQAREQIARQAQAFLMLQRKQQEQQEKQKQDEILKAQKEQETQNEVDNNEDSENT